VLTGAGIFFPEDKPTIVDRCIAMMIKLIDPHRFSDAKTMCQRIQESSVDWTIVRTNIQHDRCSQKPYKTGMLGMPGATSGINRKLLAQFIVDCLEKNLFINQAPVVWG
ncbi:MAG: NAD(P)H-binding protein, partial [Anaerolineae bacterium]|nr:NAD(P)H-binding protein [Anaerolineae bacterium]